MQRITFTVVALVLAFPVNTRAQEFFGAEREVWDFIERCADTDDFGEFRACFHDDFSGWNYNESMPRGVSSCGPSRYVRTATSPLPTTS